MNFGYVTIYVPELEPALEFYHGLLGLPVLRRQKIENGGELAFLGEEGKGSIEIIGSPEHAGRTYAGFTIGIETASLVQATEKLEKAGYPVLRGPISPGPDVAFSFFHDPHGVEIQLIQHN